MGKLVPDKTAAVWQKKQAKHDKMIKGRDRNIPWLGIHEKQVAIERSKDPTGSPRDICNKSTMDIRTINKYFYTKNLLKCSKH